jgi:hypothetical protein
MNNDNVENYVYVNNEEDKFNNNFFIDKNEILSKVMQNSDKDLYASQKPFRAKNDQWYSVSIPLNIKEAKWDFIKDKKGERDIELIQKEPELKDENE